MKNLIALCILFFVLQSSQGQTLYSFREDNRTGLVSETGLLKSWPEAGPAMLWSNTKLPNGYSSVSFGENTVYLTGIVQADEVLVALDDKGAVKWQTVYGRAWNDAFPESRCTPTVEGNRVYVTSGLGDLACIDAATGSIIWSLKGSDTYKGTFGPWGIAESVIIDGEKLYFTPGGTETNTVALNKTDGSLIWKSESMGDFPGYVSPILIRYKGKSHIVNVSEKHVSAIDAVTGSVVWKINHLDIHAEKSVAVWPDAPRIKCVTPLYNNGKIFITGGYNHGSFMLELQDEGKNASIAWYDSILDVHHGGVVLIDGYIYGANWVNNGDGNWCCLDWNTGAKKWEEHWKCKGSIIAADGMLYIYDEKSGYVGLVKANPEKFDLVSSFKVSGGVGPYWAHPVIHEGKLYIRHGTALMAYNIKQN